MTEIQGIQRHVWAWAIGAVFSFLACIISIYHVREHYYWNKSRVAKYEIRVLFMVPVYAIEAWLGLYQKKYSLYWDVLRECYEALVIYSFFQLLVTYIGGNEKLDQILEEKHKIKQSILKKEHVTCTLSKEEWTPEQHEEYECLHAGEHLTPCNWVFAPYDLMGNFHNSMRVGILQYVPIKLLMALITLITGLTGTYQNGEFEPDAAYPYVALITNISQIWAMYCLVLFYHGLYDKIKNIKPLAKFLSVKLVVFFTFWQSVAIAFFVKMQYLHATQTYTDEQVSAGVQDFIICIEMFIAAIAHIYVFPAKEFYDEGLKNTKMVRMASVLNPKDLVLDMHSNLVKPHVQRIKDSKHTQKLRTVCGCVTVAEDAETSQDDSAPTTQDVALAAQAGSSSKAVNDDSVPASSPEIERQDSTQSQGSGPTSQVDSKSNEGEYNSISDS